MLGEAPTTAPLTIIPGSASRHPRWVNDTVTSGPRTPTPHRLVALITWRADAGLAARQYARVLHDRPTAVRRAFTLSVLGTVVWTLDVAITQLILPEAQKALGMSFTDSQWIFAAGLVGFVAFGLIGGWVGDSRGPVLRCASAPAFTPCRAGPGSPSPSPATGRRSS